MRDVSLGRADGFLPAQSWETTNGVTVPIWVAGLYFLFFKPEGKRYRLIGWMYLMNTIGLPLGSYNVAFLNTGTATSPNWRATANSGAIFETRTPPVPEPSYTILLAAGLLLIGCLARSWRSLAPNKSYNSLEFAL